MTDGNIEQTKSKNRAPSEAVLAAATEVSLAASNLQDVIWTDAEPYDNPELCAVRDCDFMSRLPSVLRQWFVYYPDAYNRTRRCVEAYVQDMQHYGLSEYGPDELQCLLTALRQLGAAVVDEPGDTEKQVQEAPISTS